MATETAARTTKNWLAPVRSKAAMLLVLAVLMFIAQVSTLGQESATPEPASTPVPDSAIPEPASTLPDLSGLSWIEDDVFVAVHDAKRGDEDDRPRVSIVQLPTDPEGITYQPLDIAWPDGALSNDLESIARIPHTTRLLLVESGDDGTVEYQRIFLATLSEGPDYTITIDGVVPWPESVFNVEGSTVVELDGVMYFAYAERAEGEPVTELRWASIDVMETSLAFGSFQGTPFTSELQGTGVRPIVGLDADGDGHLYAVTAYDSGNDDGPFRSVISRAGQFQAGPDGEPLFVQSGEFGGVAQLDGFKVEGIAVAETTPGELQIYAGTDDENYGATLRLVWPIED
jgi:hypothetical protein